MSGNRVRFKADLDDKVSSGLDKIRDKLDQVGGKGAAATFTGVAAAKGLNLIGDAAYGAGQAVGDFIHDSINAASDLNESVSKAHVVFGGMADEAEHFGDKAADAFGISKQAAIEAESTFGNVFTGLKIGQPQAEKMSETLVGLAGDLASFNNIDPTAALEKLRSGLAGESEPLRSVGVFLTEAKVKAKAMELGLADAHGELSEGAKIQARYALILQETTSAQGDFARTADGLANSQRKANAELTNLEANLGEKMLPTQKGVVELQIDLFTGLNTIADAASGKVTPAVLAMDHALGASSDTFAETRQHLADLDQETVNTGVALGFWTQAEADAAQMARETGGSLNYLGDSLAGVADRGGRDAISLALAFDPMATHAESAAHRIIAANNNVLQSSIDAAHNMVTGYFDLVIAKDGLAANSAEIAAQKRIIASAKSTTAEKNDARAALHQLEADQLGYLTTLAAGGKSGTATFTKAMEELQSRLTKAHGEEAAAIREEIRLMNLLAAKAALSTIFNGAHPVSTHGGGRADGGPVWPGQTYTVGERGPETLIMGGAGGYVAPGARTGDGGSNGVPVEIPVVINGREIGRIVDDRLYYALANAPSQPRPS